MSYTVTVDNYNFTIDFTPVTYTANISQVGQQGVKGNTGTIEANTGATINGDLNITDKIVHAGDTDTAIRFPVADTVTVETAGAERLRIIGGGNVGIGTSSPLHKLHIAGSNTDTSISIASGVSSGIQRATFEKVESSKDLVIGASEGATPANTVFNRALNTEAMRIASGGNVGIGNSAPDYKLDVNGTFGFTPGASVTPVDNGDVVFELTNDTTLTIKAKGSDGVVRSGTITLA